MAVKEAAPRSRRINPPSLAERLARGRTARDGTPPPSHEQGYEEFVKAVRSGRLEAVEGV